MYVSRNVGVRRTRRKKVIISFVFLASVFGLWQYLKDNDGIIRADRQDVAVIDNVRVVMDNQNVASRTFVASGCKCSIPKNTTILEIRIVGNASKFSDIIPLHVPVGEIGGNVKTELIVNNSKYVENINVLAHNKSNNSSLHHDNNDGLLQNVIESPVNVSDEAAELKNRKLSGSALGITNSTQNRNITVKDRPTVGTNSSKLLSDITPEITHPRYSARGGQFKFLRIANSSAFAPPHPRQKMNIDSRFSETDRKRLTLLSAGRYHEIYEVERHEIRLVAYDAPTASRQILPRVESCAACATIKLPRFINDVLAFHVDRTLGLERALPASARKFRSRELKDLGFSRDLINDTFPVMWFANDLIHGGEFQPDQNSVQLNWRKYQWILRHCQNMTGGKCTDIEYHDWSRMAILDFLMQNNDRLDRYCCGYTGELTGSCYRNGARAEIGDDCGNIDRRYLVHILTSKSNPRHLVLLDNHGKLRVLAHQLNYEILKGIRTIPRHILENINSAEFSERLESSLRCDVLYTESIGEENLALAIERITERVDRLKVYIAEHNITQPITDIGG